MSVVGADAERGVTWVLSYVTDDHRKTFCIYDAPDAERIRKAAKLNQAASRQDHTRQRARPVLFPVGSEPTKGPQVPRQTGRRSWLGQRSVCHRPHHAANPVRRGSRGAPGGRSRSPLRRRSGSGSAKRREPRRQRE
ncbi:MAG TPA: nickel-binding protein [Candidatus Dormibacteraeota bacterium]|nr:nickel-binding protein [Candidatus Dormibacteraeota bacterium]